MAQSDNNNNDESTERTERTRHETKDNNQLTVRYRVSLYEHSSYGIQPLVNRMDI